MSGNALLHQIEVEALACGVFTGRPILSARVLHAFALVSRRDFVPRDLIAAAEEDRPLPSGHGQTISQPFIVALMTELADVHPGDRVLEIGTGSGYQAAILSRLAREVVSIECIPELAVAARERLIRLGFANVDVVLGDGRAGHPARAPYDAILVTAASAEIPTALIEQLRVGGRLVIPSGGPHQSQHLVRAVKREDGELDARNCLDVRFVPLVHPSLEMP